MPEYQIYMLDGRGRVVSGLSAQCVDDDVARALSRQRLRSGTNAELWEGTRYLGVVQSADPPAGAGHDTTAGAGAAVSHRQPVAMSAGGRG